MLDCVPIPEMDTPSKPELRHATRIHCRVAVQLKTSDGRDLAATCLDVSVNGIGIETNYVLAVGQRLHLMVPKANGDISHVPMLVIYRMENRFGLSALGAYEDVLNLIPVQA